MSVGDIQECGCVVKRPRVAESISDEDLCHVFDKADRDKDNRLNRRVRHILFSKYDPVGDNVT